ncbi:MAG: DNA repair protein RadC [Bacteroidota bacterium]
MYKSLNIKNWAEEDRPREKLSLKGKSVLSEAELIAILIRSGTASISAVDVAKGILNSAGNDLNQLAKLTVKDLTKFKGIGEAKAISIVAALELGRRRKETDSIKKPKIRSSKDAYNLMRSDLLDLSHEEFWCLLLNRSNLVIKKHLVSSGGVSGTVADPKLIFKAALDVLASGIILVHNHPSGNLEPSQSDINLTKKMKTAAMALDISLHDHLIFTEQGYFSFADENFL